MTHTRMPLRGRWVAAVLGSIGCACSRTPSPTSADGPPAPQFPRPAAIAYQPEIAAILASDCMTCHSESADDPPWPGPLIMRRPRAAHATYVMDTYEDVLTRVRPGDPNSPLVVRTRPGNDMFQRFSNDADAKAAMIYDWVVVYGAPASHDESR